MLNQVWLIFIAIILYVFVLKKVGNSAAELYKKTAENTA
jgi:hypothetical protein